MLRNWLVGFYISEYELKGEDRAEYGKNLLTGIAQKCKIISGMSERNIYLFSAFYKNLSKRILYFFGYILFSRILQ